MEADKRRDYNRCATNTTTRQHKNENAIVVTVGEVCLMSYKKKLKGIGGGSHHRVCNYTNKEDKFHKKYIRFFCFVQERRWSGKSYSQQVREREKKKQFLQVAI